jgi:putative hemolysin
LTIGTVEMTAQAGLSFYPPTVGSVIAIVTALLLLAVSGFVSASEVAFFSLSPEELKQIRESDNPSDRRIVTLLNNSERLLASILITNNLVNVAIILLLDLAIGLLVDFATSVWFEFFVITVLLTFVLLLFGEE